MGYGERIKTAYLRLTENKDIAGYLYFVGFAAYLLVRAWDSTMFPKSALLKAAGAVLFVLCIGLKILLYDRFTVREVLFFGVCLAAGGLSFLKGGDIHFLLVCLLVAGSRKIRFEQILRVWLCLILPVMLLAFAGAMLGIIENRTGLRSDELLGIVSDEHYAYGIINTTDCAARVFFAFLAAFCLRGKKLTFLFPLLSLAAAVCVFYFTQGRLDSLCLLLLAVLSAGTVFSRNLRKRNRDSWKFWTKAALLAMPLAALTAFLFCAVYTPSDPFLKDLDLLFSRRLSYGKCFFEEYGINLFGHPIEMVGNGGAGLELQSGGAAYSFIDISYQQILLINGLLPFLLVLCFYAGAVWKNRKDVYFQISVCLIALNCMVAHHLLDISYVPFIAAFLAEERGSGGADRDGEQLIFRSEETLRCLRLKAGQKNACRKDFSGNRTAVSTLRKNYVLNLALTATSFLFPFLTFRYASGILQPAGTGRVSFANSVITYFNLFAQLGIPTYGIRAVARCRNDRKERSRVAAELLLLNLLTGAVSLLLLFLVSGALPRLASERTLLLVLCPVILFRAIGIDWFYKGIEEYGFITVRSLVCQVFALAAMFFLVRTEKDVAGYAAVTVIATSAGGIFNFIHARRLIDRSALKNGLNLRRHWKPVLVFFSMSCAVTIYTSLDVTMLGFLKTDTEVGYYDAAVKVKTALTAVITALGGVILPRASWLLEQGEKERFRIMVRKALSFVLFLALPLTVFFMLYAGESIRLIAGAAYEGAVQPMVIIMPALLLIGITNVTGMQVLVPAGKEKIVLYSEIAGAVTDFILNLLLIPRFGASGAAFGTLAAEAAVLTVQCLALKQEAVSPLFRVPWRKTVLCTAAATLCALVSRKLLTGASGAGSFCTLLTGAFFFGSGYLLTGMLIGKKEIGELLRRDPDEKV